MKMRFHYNNAIIIIKLDCKYMPELTVTKLKLKILSCNSMPYLANKGVIIFEVQLLIRIIVVLQ